MVKVSRAMRKASVALIFCALLLSIASFAVYRIQSGDWVWAWPEQPLSGIRPEIGLAYVAPTDRPDLSSHEGPSSAAIFEDGRRLGPANAQHADIRTQGAGRYSFWHDYVYLSSSDGTDPRTNGRQYTYRHPPVSDAAALAVYALTLIIDIIAVVLLAPLLAAAATALAVQVPARLTAAAGRIRYRVGSLQAAVAGLNVVTRGVPFTAARRDVIAGVGGIPTQLRPVFDVVEAPWAEPVGSAAPLDREPPATSRATRAAPAGWLEQALPRRLAFAGLAGLTAALLMALTIDPVPVLTWTSRWIGILLAGGLTIGAGCALAISVAPRNGPHALAAPSPQPTGLARLRTLSQVVVLLGLALLAWLRPWIPDLSQVYEAAPVAFMCLAAGFVLYFVLPRRVQHRILEWRHGGSLRAGLVLTVACVLVALPILALPVARNWDSSGFMDSHSYDAFAINIVNGKVPAGSSQYMPAYQYGLAFVYYIWGHFFFVQQIVNLVLACVGIACLCGAGWILFRSAAAVAAIGLMAGLSQPFRYAIHFTQIESWFVPVTCVLLLAWAYYWRSGTWKAALALAAAVSVGMNMRNQGTPFFALVCITPLLVPFLRWPHRLAHTAVIVALVGASLVPWTVRNYVVDGRFSPSGSRSTLYIGTLNDRRIGLYGIRYWEGWTEVAAEFTERYPDLAERERALIRSMWDNLVADPGWLARALYWRTAAFYGLLPSGYLGERIVPTNWAVEWPSYLYWRSTAIVVLPLSLLGLFIRPGRTTLFLTAAILANLSINLVSATSEDRLSYPVLLLHMLLAGAIFGAPAGTAAPLTAWTVQWRRAAVPLLAATVVFLGASRLLVGAGNIYRPLIERAVTVAPGVEPDQTLPLLEPFLPGTAETIGVGSHVRLRGMLTNYMYPPKFAGAVPWVPAFATAPGGPTYYYMLSLGGDETTGIAHRLGVTLRGALVNEPLREGDAVEMEAEVLADDRSGSSGLWLRALRVKRLPIDRAQLPPFP